MDNNNVGMEMNLVCHFKIERRYLSGFLVNMNMARYSIRNPTCSTYIHISNQIDINRYHIIVAFFIYYLLDE